jgi:hypothetical protein
MARRSGVNGGMLRINGAACAANDSSVAAKQHNNGENDQKIEASAKEEMTASIGVAKNIRPYQMAQ